ncbi:MAG: NADH-quinone oxidoreductase subunit L, partial [Chloroflexi bacterium]|nr:NADH-quinone oxidoreductase subunit L [Chloroflexota bacterium]
MHPDTLLWFIPLPPIAAFFLIVLFTNRSKWLSHTVAVGGMAISWALSLWIFWQSVKVEHLGEHPFASSVDWMPTGYTALRFGVLLDPLAAITLFFVALTCLMIFIYSVGYMGYGTEEVDPNYSRFFAYISLFAAGMLGLVVSENLLTLFISWEIMGLCSYLLIGFWF